MDNIKLQETTVKEFMQMKTVVESFQGALETGRHDQAQFESIINSLLSGDDIGIITLAETELKTLSQLDGNSRYNNIRKFVADLMTIKIKDVDGKGIATKYSELPKEKQDAFMNSPIHLFIYYGLDKKQRSEKFVKLNSSKSLTATQKNKGLVSDNFTAVADLVSKYTLEKGILTDKLMLRDEHNAITAQIIANITDCYTASNAKLMDNIRDKEIDVDKIADILYTLKDDKAHNKYSFISAVSVLYGLGDIYKVKIQRADKSGYESHDIKIKNLNLVNRLCITFPTAGANSVPKNTERLEQTTAELKAVATEYIKANRTADKTFVPTATAKKVTVSQLEV